MNDQARLRAAGDIRTLGIDFSASDTAEIPAIKCMSQEAMYVGAGTLRVTSVNGTVVNFADGELAAGVPHPLRVARIHETGTTVTDLKLLFN